MSGGNDSGSRRQSDLRWWNAERAGSHSSGANVGTGDEDRRVIGGKPQQLPVLAPPLQSFAFNVELLPGPAQRATEVADQHANQHEAV